MKPRETKIGWQKNIDKLLFIFASFYLIIVLAWLWKQQQERSLALSNSQIFSPEIKEEFSSNAQAQLLSSSEQISPTNPKQNIPLDDRQIASDSRTEEIKEPLTTSTVLSSQKEPVNTSKDNYQEQTTTSSLPLPSIPPPLPVIEIPAPPPLPAPTPLPTKVPPPPSPPPKLATSSPPPAKIDKVPVMKTINQRALISSNQGIDSSPSYPINKNISNKTHTLTGILELENNASVALFKIDNSTERVKVGSEIGTTGWLLVDISGKQATINRQNQSLSLTVGEQF